MKPAGWLALALLLGLGACAGRPANVMLPVSGSAPGARAVSLLVATTRRPLPDDPATLFGGDRSLTTSFVHIGVSIPPNHQVGELEWPDPPPGDPARQFVTVRADRIDRTAFRASLRNAVRRSGVHQVLLFVHGYNNRFDEAVFRFAQITADSGSRAIPVLFTWPSRGSLLGYPYDRESATFSRDALETIIADLVAEPEVQDVAILAHSMGNWVTLEALRQQAIRKGRVPAKVRNLMLAAPDVDIDVARTQIRDLGPSRPRITLFVSQDDLALEASQTFWGSRAQLGSINPDIEPYKGALERARISVVDLTKMNSGDPLNHAKFAESPEVVRSIGARLAAGQQIDTTTKGLGLIVGDAAQKLGAVAAAAVTIPVAIVDPQARAALGERVDTIVPGAQDKPGVASE